MDFYATAFTFWQLLATEKAELEGGFALANTHVPYYLSNAAWYPKPGRLKTITEWYAARHLPPALITPAQKDADLEQALHDGPFMVDLTFTFSLLSPTGVSGASEQINWTQLRYAGEIFASHYQQVDLALSISTSLGKAMQTDARALAFLNYAADANKPAGAMIAFETEDALTAMLLADNAGVLEQRLYEEALIRNKQAFLFQALPENTCVFNGASLERWSIQ